MINREIEITKERKDRAHALAESIGISNKLNQYPEQLSGGERQRLAIARALVTDPSIVIADEPTGNLDGETAATVMQEIIKQSTGNGSTLITITHDESLLGLFENTINVGDFSTTFSLTLKNIIHIALKHIVFHKAKSVIQIAALTLTFFLPLATAILVKSFSTNITERGRETPLLFGPKGDRFDLTINSLFFRGDHSSQLSMADFQ